VIGARQLRSVRLRKGGSAVIKFSGSLIYPPSASYLSDLRETVKALLDEGWRIAVVVGGGEVAREYIRTLRALGVPESLLDEIGIESANLNALSVALALYPLSPPAVPRDLREAVRVSQEGLVPVLGGLQPGQSTNAVAAVLAEAIKADLLVNLLNGVDGVYTGRPGEPSSRKIDNLTYSQLEEIILGKEQVAGGYELFDRVALEIVKRSRLTLVFADGRNPAVLVKVIRGEGVGSWVRP